jgi:hypothetical protein
MPQTTYVYRCNDADLLADWERYQKDHAKWRRKIKRQIGSWFPRQGRCPVVQHPGFGGTERWIGVSSVHGDYRDPPEGWRYDRKHGHLMPLKKTKEGREIAKVIDATTAPETMRKRLPGMPGHLWSGRHGLHTYMPGIQRMGDAIYVTWSVELIAKEDGYDPKLWKRVKLSEYHALREAEGKAA